MTARHSPNTPVANQQEQILLYYHWLTFCNEFTELEANGVWTYLLAGTDGIINSSTPSKFYISSGIFTISHVGMYLAIKDNTNPVNTTIVQITNFNNTNEVQLNAPVANFTVDSTDVEYRLIDPTTLPSLGSYFVIENTVEGQPSWQARFEARAAAPLTVGVQFAPIGGWDINTSLWTLPVCTEVLMEPTVAQSFMVSDPDQGWNFFWTEDVGGIGSNRKGIWFGSLSPLHAPEIAGAPSDTSYAAIFGDTTGAPALNIDRDTTTVESISTGETLHSDNTVVAIYFAQKRLLGSSTDVNTIAAAVFNTRSGEADDYDIIAFQKSPNQSIRGRVSGLRLMNDSLSNRDLISSGLTYCIDNGIGVVWNTKPVV